MESMRYKLLNTPVCYKLLNTPPMESAWYNPLIYPPAKSVCYLFFEYAHL